MLQTGSSCEKSSRVFSRIKDCPRGFYAKSCGYMQPGLRISSLSITQFYPLKSDIGLVNFDKTFIFDASFIYNARVSFSQAAIDGLTTGQQSVCTGDR